MTEPSANITKPRRRWLRWTLGILVTLLALSFAVSHVIEVNVVEYYSRGWHSDSSSAAESHHILVSRPVVPIKELPFQGHRLAVQDAWIEHQTHVEYPYYLFPRTIRDSALRIVLRTARVPGLSTNSCNDWLAYDSTDQFGTDGTYFFANINPPAPDTLWLSVVHPATC